jgi:hypothetical protein
MWTQFLVIYPKLEQISLNILWPCEVEIALTVASQPNINIYGIINILILSYIAFAHSLEEWNIIEIIIVLQW